MNTDVAVVGAGPAGAAAAIWLRRRGIDTVVVEREDFPRFHIGESMTGQCRPMVEDLGLAPVMAELGAPVKHGTAVYGAKGRNRFYVPVMARREDGGLEPATAWQVRRSGFDHALRERAVAAGVDVVQGRAMAPLVDDDGRVTGLRVRSASTGRQRTIRARVVLDASGQGKFLAHSGVTSPIVQGRYFRQVAVFTHVAGALRDEGEHPDDTVIFYRQAHHWGWFIPIDGETTSVGVVVPAEYFRSFRESPDAFFRREVLALNPELTRRLPKLDCVEEVRTVANYSYRVADFTGPGHLCVGDAHRFIDPIFSFGVFVALAEARFAAECIASVLEHGPVDPTDPFAAHRERSEAGLDRFQTLIDGFWSNPLAFGLLVHRRHRDDFLDLFAGRVYDHDSEGLRALKRLTDRALADGRPTASAVPR